MRYRTDADYEKLIRPSATANGMPECLPRVTVCGSSEAERMGLTPMLDYPDKLIDPKDFKEVIQHCHDQQIFPMYHLKETGFDLKAWNQNGLPYCWAWGVTGITMNARALEGQSPVLLRPVSLGRLVNWRRVGYYCDRTIAGARKYGIASAEFIPDQHSLNPKQFEEGWEEDALNHRPSEWWDTRRTSEMAMIQQCLTVLSTSRGGYIAHNWWGHALGNVGMLWDESEYQNIVWVDWNSHRDGLIELAGPRGIPDEFYGIRSTSLPLGD